MRNNVGTQAQANSGKYEAIDNTLEFLVSAMEAEGFQIFCTRGQDQRPSVWVKMPGNPKRDFPDAHASLNMACEAQPELRQELPQFLMRTRRGPYAKGRDAA